MDLQAARDEARRLLLDSQFDEAAIAYRELLTAYPDCPEAHNELGLTLLEQDEPDCAAAVAEFTAADALWSAAGSLARATALTNWGRALLQLSRYDEAAERFAAADEVYESDDPESADRKYPLRYWGELLRLQDRYAESEVRCRAALAADRTDPVSANTLGIVLEAQGPLRAADAIEAYTQACALYAADDPTNPDGKFPLRNWGGMLHAQGRFAEAEAKYRQALEVDHIDPITHNLLGVSLEAQGPDRHAEALEQYCHSNDLYLAGDPENPARKLPLWNCGDMLRLQGHWTEAEARYREALAIDPSSAALTNLLGLAVHGQGVARFAEAIGHYRDADAEYAANDGEDPNRKYPLRNWGDVLRAEGRFADAEAKYREALALDPRDPLTRNALGGALEGQGPERYDEAIEQYRESTALLTDDEQAGSARAYPLRRWGNLLHAQGHLQEAEDRFRTACAADPDDPALANSLGVVLEAQGAPRHADAIAAYRDAIALYAAHDPANPSRRVPLRNWGDVLRAEGQVADAEARYREALEIDPTDPVTHNSLGAALQAHGQTRFADAIDHYRASVAAYEAADPADPDRKYPLRKWADVLSAQGRLGEAEERLRAARAADPSDPTIVNALGVALETQGAERRAEAIETYRDALALYVAHDPANANRKFPLRNWGDVLRAQGHPADAETRYREALAADPADPATRNSLGAVLQLQGRDRYPEAIEQYRESAQLYAADASTTTNRRYPLRNWGDVLRLQGRWAEAEAKYREALAVDPEDAGSMNSLGIALQGRGPECHADALAAFDASAARFAAVGSLDAIYPLHNASWLLGEMEDFEAALQKQRTALATKPDSAEEHYLLANTLANASQYRDALDAFERAIQLDANDPFPRHNKAHYLFYLGRYAEGWKAWDDARGAYSRSFRAGLPDPVDVERAQHHAAVLATVYYERDEAERLFRMVADKDPSQAEMLCGLATLYYQWANSEKPSASAQATLSAAIRKAASALRERVGKDDGWKSSLDLADLYIEVEDFGAAEEWLVRAEAACGEMRVRRGRVASRFGILHAKREHYDKAVDKLQEALRIFPEDVKVRANLAEAYLKLHQLDRAESEFRRVAALAPGNIEALIGSAQLCIELADDGDMDRCTQAEKFLSDAIQHGEHSSSGSKRLTGKDLAEVYYLRGYVRAKRYEADSGRPLLLPAAERDFRTCLRLDPANFKAESAVQKLRARRRSLQRGTLFEWLGPIVVGFAATCVFVLTQLDFFFGGQEVFGVPIHATRKLDQPGFYVLTTFGSLVFMVASLYLPKVLKLKVGAIELEKSTVEQISTPVSLGIGR